MFTFDPKSIDLPGAGASDPARFSVRPLPVSNNEIPSEHVAGSTVANLPGGESVRFTRVKDSLIVGPSEALVFLQGEGGTMYCVDSSLLPCIAPITFLPEVLSCPGMLLEPKERVLEDPALFLAGQASRAPFHWPHDALTRLLAFERTGESARILIPSYQANSRFIVESLRLLGIAEDRIEYIHPNERIRAKELWLSEDLAPHDPKLNVLLEMLRTRMLEGAGCDPYCSRSLGQGRSVYISRQGTPEKRGIQNADEFLELAQRYGFEEHRLERLSVREQVRLAAETTRVLAPHGAGLFNTLYMPGGDVVEMFPIDSNGKDTNLPCWGRLLDAHASQGRSLSWRAIESAIIRSSDRELDKFLIIADLDKIEACLRAPHSGSTNVWTRV